MASSVPSSSDPHDTRQRILRAALRLFRQHGYHGVGIADILAQAQTPKGSMYHHFPGGKEEIGAAVVGLIADGVVGLLDAVPNTVTAAPMMVQVGRVFLDGMVRTRHELCALFATFVAQKDTAPRLAAAVDEAYSNIADRLAQRLRASGFTPTQARDRASLVVMLLEGGSLVAAARDDVAPFKLALKQAVSLCQLPAKP